jgi:hypothetical protein
LIDQIALAKQFRCLFLSAKEELMAWEALTETSYGRHGE